jgi:hypothetical protein
MGVGGLMALERDPSTTKNAVLLLQGAGRGSISEHGAQMAIELLESNGFQIWEIKPDEPEEPKPVEKVPTYASKESLQIHYREVRELQDSLDRKMRDLFKEFTEALYDLDPVLEAIRRAMETPHTVDPSDVPERDN